MSELERLQAAVIAAPQAEAPRRAYADAVRASDPDRAKLIELQLVLRAKARRGEEARAERVAARELVKRHGARWAGPLAKLVQYFMFWGGFIEEVKIAATDLPARADTLARLEPIRFLKLTELAGRIPEIAQLAFLDQIVALDVGYEGLTDADIAQLVASPHLRKLRALMISGNSCGRDAMRAIAANLPELQFVESAQTDAPIVIRSTDWDGSVADVGFSAAREKLVTELGHKPWLDTLAEPSYHAL